MSTDDAKNTWREANMVFALQSMRLMQSIAFNNHWEDIVKTKTDNCNEITTIEMSISTDAARSYITDMLTELCTVAEQSGQKDLFTLLKLTMQAAQNAT